jgi:hypothetical protein
MRAQPQRSSCHHHLRGGGNQRSEAVATRSADQKRRGAAGMGTPDGREGWAEFFCAHGFEV